MALEARNVTRTFTRARGGTIFRAVDEVTLTLESGTVMAVTGPSGSGKSTLLSMMAGILEPTQGIVEVDGTDLYTMDDVRLSAFRNEHIGVVPQGQTAIHSLTVLENVLVPARFRFRGGSGRSGGAGRAEGDAIARVRERADMLLEKTGIADLKDAMPSELSGGELRRMAIARAMILNPGVILADEPTADLDEENTAIVLSLLRFAADEGGAVLVVTHDKDVLSGVDETRSMRHGRLEDKLSAPRQA